jgi:hypothetical protein
MRRDHEGRTPFDVAQLREHGRAAPLSSLLIAGKVSDGPTLEGLESLRRESARRWEPPNGHLEAAISNRNLSEVRLLLADGADPDGRWSRRPSPLWLARRAGLTDVVEALVDAGASREEGGTTFGWTAEAEDHQQRVWREHAGRIAALGPRGAGPELVARVDLDTAHRIRAHPTLASRRVGGRTVASISADYGLAQTMQAVCDLAPKEVEREPRSLLTGAASHGSAATLEVLLRHGLDPLRAELGLSPLVEIARDGQIDALVTSVAFCRDPKMFAKQLRMALRTMMLGRGRIHHIAGFLRQLLLATRGRIEGVSVEVRKRSKTLSASDSGASLYFAEVQRIPPGRTPEIVAVRSPPDRVITARARGCHEVVESAHRTGVPWVPRAEIVLRIGSSPWTLVVPFGPCPETALGMARTLGETLETTAVLAAGDGRAVYEPGGTINHPTIENLDGFCRAEGLLLPGMEIGIDLGIVDLDVFGVAPGSVSDAWVVVVTPDRYLERSSQSERDAIEQARALAYRSSKPRSRRG